jgi:hypothetical protein
MTDLPEPVTLDWIARQLLDAGDGTASLRARIDTLIEVLSRMEARTVAIREAMRTFNAEMRRR